MALLKADAHYPHGFTVGKSPSSLSLAPFSDTFQDFGSIVLNIKFGTLWEGSEKVKPTECDDAPRSGEHRSGDDMVAENASDLSL
jgi:hypothetical protein